MRVLRCPTLLAPVRRGVLPICCFALTRPGHYSGPASGPWQLRSGLNLPVYCRVRCPVLCFSLLRVASLAPVCLRLIRRGLLKYITAKCASGAADFEAALVDAIYRVLYFSRVTELRRISDSTAIVAIPGQMITPDCLTLLSRVSQRVPFRLCMVLSKVG